MQMKIPLSYSNNETLSAKSAQAKVLIRDVVAAKQGDWKAKNHLAQTFMPLITSLAQKRSNDKSEINRYIEAGKDGLFKAVKKYKDNKPEGFQLFALNFIEESMNKAIKGKGFFSKLFGG